jgi:hypothetical protein
MQVFNVILEAEALLFYVVLLHKFYSYEGLALTVMRILNIFVHIQIQIFKLSVS